MTHLIDRKQSLNAPPRPEPPAWHPNPAGIDPESGVAFRRTQEQPLEVLKNRLLREALGNLQEAGLLALTRRAANEAAALAWLETEPLLVFPELFAEKLEYARGQARRQFRIRVRTARLTEVLE